MRARLIVIIISSISGEHTAQVALAKNNDMIQAFAAERPDQALGDAIFQGALGDIGRSQMPIALTRVVKTCP
jgi:hypothetical protein